MCCSNSLHIHTAWIRFIAENIGANRASGVPSDERWRSTHRAKGCDFCADTFLQNSSDAEMIANSAGVIHFFVRSTLTELGLKTWLIEFKFWEELGIRRCEILWDGEKGHSMFSKDLKRLLETSGDSSIQKYSSLVPSIAPCHVYPYRFLVIVAHWPAVESPDGCINSAVFPTSMLQQTPPTRYSQCTEQPN